MKTVYFNGKIYTTGMKLFSAFAVENGRFIATGSDDEMLALFGENCEKIKRINLNGKFVCAGFNDSHMHLLNYGQSLLVAKLYEHTGSLAELLTCMKNKLNTLAKESGVWLRGRGWNQDYFSDVKRMPNRYDLDSVSTDVPILITRACGHCCVVNSKVLELTGITSDTMSPEGGAIGMENGEPDGRLYDNAMELVFDKMPLPDKPQLKTMIRLACESMNRFGITSAQTDDYCVFRRIPFEMINEAYRELEEAGELSVRIYEQCNFTELDELKRFINEGNITGKGSALFKIGPLKLLGDGSLGSRSAHLSLPYLGDDENCGFSLLSSEQLNALCSYANSNGMQIAVHAIGDACLDTVLDVIEQALRENQREDHRHGIVHCQISRSDQLDRMIRLKLHIYAQSIFLDYDNHIVEKLVPAELVKTSYNWKRLMDGGLIVSNGSDCPVELPDVMKGIECAVTRRSMDGMGPYLEDQAFSVKEALDSFTVNGAIASFEENIKGRIEVGQLADFVVLNADPFEVKPNKLHTIEIEKTFLGGNEVYSKPAAN